MSSTQFVPTPARNTRGPLTSIVRLAAVGILLGSVVSARAQTTSFNTGSLGSAGNATNAASVTFGAGVVTAGGDQTANYDGVSGTSTSLSYNAVVNPVSANPFTIEFWARPTGSDNDDSPVSNRVSAGNRSGWAFFQREAGTGWNFRMYNGNGSALGWDLTGGTSTLNSWSHVVATWNGSSATLYVNGAVADSTNDPAANGVYNASTSANFIIAATDSGSPYAGSVDETAFYGTALTPAQILNHYNKATTGTAGEYHAIVQSEGAVLQFSNNPVPEPGTILLGAGAALVVGNRVFRRKKAPETSGK
jgi:hypothetical protein